MTERRGDVPQPAEQRLAVPGPAGDLEALFRGIHPSRQPRGAALLCHPHPLFGGTMHNKTLYRIAKLLPAAASVPVLRFNFRGVGSSGGGHDGGRGEIDDARCALAWLRARVPKVPLAVVGYSFGAAIGLRAGSDDPSVGWLVGIGLPLRAEWDLSYLSHTHKPRMFVHGENDEFASGAELMAWARTLPGPVSIRIVPGADHLFTGLEDEAVHAVVRYVTDVTAPPDEE